MNHNIYNYLYLNRGAVPKEICSDIIKISETPNYPPWAKHTWSYQDNHPDAGSKSLDKDPDVNNLYPETDNGKHNASLRNFIFANFAMYGKKNTALIPHGATSLNSLRLNRYKVGNELAPHIDNIKTIFDGQKKGVPILSVIINLNSEYTGGEVIFNEEKEIVLGTGDVLIFPSNFLYSHQIKPILSGTRYSIVAWGY